MIQIALLTIGLLVFCAALAKWYIYLENQGAVIYMGLTWVIAGFVCAFLCSGIGLQFGKKYLFISTLLGTLLGFGSQLILSLVQDIHIRFFKSELFKHK